MSNTNNETVSCKIISGPPNAASLASYIAVLEDPKGGHIMTTVYAAGEVGGYVDVPVSMLPNYNNTDSTTTTNTKENEEEMSSTQINTATPIAEAIRAKKAEKTTATTEQRADAITTVAEDTTPSILGSIWGFLGAAADAVVAAKDYVVEVYEDPNTQKNIELAGVVAAAYAVDVANFTCTVAGYVADAVVTGATFIADGATFVSEASDMGAKSLSSTRNQLSYKGAMLMASDEGKAALAELEKTMQTLAAQKEEASEGTAEFELVLVDSEEVVEELEEEIVYPIS